MFADLPGASYIKWNMRTTVLTGQRGEFIFQGLQLEGKYRTHGFGSIAANVTLPSVNR